MIKGFIMLIQLVLMIGRWLERRQWYNAAMKDVEIELEKLSSKLVKNAAAARDAVDDAGVRDDKRNRDNWPKDT